MEMIPTLGQFASVIVVNNRASIIGFVYPIKEMVKVYTTSETTNWVLKQELTLGKCR